MTEHYRTVKQQASDELIIQKSRFIGHAAPVETEDQALDFLRSIREKHHNASHNCYAYILGYNQGIIRYSDDGEPSGTAGLPMIDVIRNQGMINCIVVATRYFGGILLGTGGLVRAYTQTCKIALQAAEPVVMCRTCRYVCRLPYSFWDRLNHYLENTNAYLDDVLYTDQISFVLVVKEEEASRVLAAVANVTARTLAFEDPVIAYEPWNITDS